MKSLSENTVTEFQQSIEKDESSENESPESTPLTYVDEEKQNLDLDVADHSTSDEQSIENSHEDNLDKSSGSEEKIEDTTSVEQRLKKISEEIEKYSSGSSVDTDGDNLGRQSFFSLSDLIKTLRPSDKKIPQIDSDYSNTMRVLGETTSIVGGSNTEDARKLKEAGELKLSNRALN